MDTELEQVLDRASSPRRRRDARTMLELMTRITAHPPVVSGTVIGFASYEYRYESGRRGSGPAAAFAPRKDSLVVYLVDGVRAHPRDLARLGPHTEGVGSIAIKDLELVDLGVLEHIIATSYATPTAGVHTLRARDGRPG
jgi:hypothetical protein